MQTVAQTALLTGPGAIVSCIPNIPPPKTHEEIEVRKVIEKFLEKDEKGAIEEMCYHPIPYTEIAKISEGRGWQVILGTEAMFYQGLEQDRHWTGQKLSELPSKQVHIVVDVCAEGASEMTGEKSIRA
jgi:quinate dehydrogenase